MKHIITDNIIQGRRLSQELVQEFSKGTQYDNTESKPPTSKDLTIAKKISDNDQTEWINLKMDQLKIKYIFKMHHFEDFETIRKNTLLFIDRSKLILKLFDELEGTCPVLITHPRRTGKSVNLTMIKDFCELQVKQNGKLDKDKQLEKKELFLGNQQGLSPLNIAQYCSDESSILSKHFQQYPVIYLSLRSLDGDNLREVRNSLKGLLSQQFQNKQYLFKKLSPDQQKVFQQYIDRTINEFDIRVGLQLLCQFLNNFHKKKVIVLVDEYDQYVNELISTQEVNYNLVRQVAKEISSMLNEVGKDQSTVQKLIITGILDSLVKKGNSMFNNLRKLGISNQACDGFYGLTEEEVMDKVNLVVDPDQDQYEEKKSLLMKQIKSEYNGYQGYASKYYNIWSVYSYLDSISYQYNNKMYIMNPSSFWEQSGFSNILSSFMEKQLNFSLKDKLLKIAFGVSQTLEYNESKVNILQKLPTDYYEQEILYSYLLVNQGYITRSYPFSNLLKNNQFQVPNGELRKEFQYIMEKHLRSSFGIIQATKLGNAFISRNESQIQAEFEESLQVIISFRDKVQKSTENLSTTQQQKKIADPQLQQLNKLRTKRRWMTLNSTANKILAKRKNRKSSQFETEQYFHTITCCFLYQMKNLYGINSELEAGYGYSDIILLPKDSQDKHAFILELKLGPKIKPDGSDAQKQLTIIANDAITQIKSKCYDAFLLKNGFKNYSYVGIAFSGKYVKVIIDHLTNE